MGIFLEEMRVRFEIGDDVLGIHIHVGANYICPIIQYQFMLASVICPYNEFYAANGSRRIMVSTRSGPVERISTGTPVTSSMRLM